MGRILALLLVFLSVYFCSILRTFSGIRHLVSMREPLVAPLVAVACGVFLARLVPFGSGELLLLIVAFAALSVSAQLTLSRRPALFCLFAAFISSAAFLSF